MNSKTITVTRTMTRETMTMEVKRETATMIVAEDSQGFEYRFRKDNGLLTGSKSHRDSAYVMAL